MRYFDRFAETMGAHPAGSAGDGNTRAVAERYYLSQCVKDETMAESIAAAFARQAGRPGAIVHFTGAFHSDFGRALPSASDAGSRTAVSQRSRSCRSATST